MKKQSSNKKYIFFYMTLFYIVSFLIWWTYLLYSKTEIYYENKLQIEQLNPNNDIANEKYDTLMKKYNREKVMIVTEGGVFLIILLLLIFRVKKAVEQEIEISRQQQNFILSITHELKSPLSSIKLMSQTLAKHNLNEDQKNKLVTNSLNEVERLQNLVENVLVAAKIDNDAYGFSKNEMNLSSLVKELVKRCVTSSNAEISTSIEEDILIDADKSGMTSIVLNLIENAVKYSPKGADVKVLLNKKEDEILFLVKDLGMGISDIEKTKVFDKFYRVGNEETRATKGTGLGLYIVKELVNYHNGNITIKDNEPNGTIFEVVFQV